MAEVGRTVPNTIAKAPITFAMIETAVSADCNARKSGWLSYGFKDVTPMFAGQSTVPSLNGSMVAQGRQMLKAMVDVGADWYMISGHHGALYQSEYDSYTTDGQPCKADMSNLNSDALHNEEKYCGFFNEAYHEGRWEHASRSNPDSHVDPREIYLRTTIAASNDIAKHAQDNPVFNKTSWVPPPKGIILSACNTLNYLTARVTWATYFPGAVIIGPFDRIVSGTWVSNAIAGAQMTNESFWRDPQSILDQPGMCEQLSKQLTAGFPRSSIIAVIYKGNVYVDGSVDSLLFTFATSHG
jgi:hypothetical protein